MSRERCDVDLPTKIVVGLDISESLIPVFNEASTLGRLLGAELALAHAIDDDISPASTAFDVLAEQAYETFAGLRLRAQFHGVALDPIDYVRAGTAESVLCEVAHDTAADWIMVGAGDRSPLERLLGDPTAESVLCDSPLPVWVVRPNAPLEKLTRIVCAVDGSEPARCATLTAAAFAQRLGAGLTLLAIGPHAKTGPVTRRLARSLIQTGTAEGKRPAFEVLTVKGDPQSEILRHLDLSEADLLVLGCAGRKGLRRVWRRNTVERLARRVPCSVLSVPSLARRPRPLFARAGAQGLHAQTHLHQSPARSARSHRSSTRGPLVGTWPDTGGI